MHPVTYNLSELFCFLLPLVDVLTQVHGIVDNLEIIFDFILFGVKRVIKSPAILVIRQGLDDVVLKEPHLACHPTGIV